MIKLSKYIIASIHVSDLTLHRYIGNMNLKISSTWFKYIVIFVIIWNLNYK